MKIGKIKKICKEDKRAYIYEEKDKAGGVYQWIGDGNSIYPSEGLPAVCPQELLAIFDIPERDWEKWNTQIFEVTEDSFLKDNFSGEERAGLLDICIDFKDYSLRPVMSETGEICFVQTKYLEPFEQKENLEYYIRKKGEQSYVAAKVGFYLAGLIAPCARNEQLQAMFRLLMTA